MNGICAGCQKHDDLRMGFCFDCASSGEKRAANRSVPEHLAHAWRNARDGDYHFMKIDLRWAWERLTRSGDYAVGGYFEREYGKDWTYIS